MIKKENPTEGVTLFTLKNGLRIMFDERSKALNPFSWISIEFFGGARVDGNLPGISHFVEHMLCCASEGVTKEDFDSRMDEMVVYTNGYTTHYKNWYVANEIEEGNNQEVMELMLNRVFDPLFQESDIERERQRILSEIVISRQSYREDKNRLILQELYGSEYEKDYLMGNEEDVRKITAQQLLDHYKHYYTADNCIVLCSGHFDQEQIVDQIIEKTKSFPEASPRHYDLHKYAFIPVQKIILSPEYKDDAYVSLVFNSNAACFSRSAREVVLQEAVLDVMDNPKHSFSNAIKNKGIYGFTSKNIAFNDSAGLFIEFWTNKDRVTTDLELFREQILSMTKNVDIDLQAYTKWHRKIQYFAQRDVANVASINADDVFLKREICSLDERYRILIEQLTREDICQTARGLFLSEPAVFVEIAPEYSNFLPDLKEYAESFRLG